VLALLVAATLTQYPQHWLHRQPNLPRQSAPSYAFFEFAPADGAGMTAACACTTPTGAKGEAMTFTRASSGTCLKGGTTSGIANGDMVTCSSNQPRVMPGGDGTGPLGLLVEGSRTNDLLRSEEFSNAAWTSGGSACTAPTVTANQAAAPDGTTTADRVQIPACTGNWSLVYQTLGSASRTFSLFIKGNGESGAVQLFVNPTCVSCSYNPDTWTRCVVPSPGASTVYYFGSDKIDCGGSNQPAKDFFVWGAQAEVGAFATSYIATAGATATRADETATFPSPGAAIEAAGCGGATMVPSWSGTSAALNMGLVTFASAGRPVYVRSSGGEQFTTFDGTTNPNIAATFTAGTAIRGVGEWSGSSLVIRNVTAGTSASSPFDGTMEAGTIELGNAAAFAGRLFSVIKRVVIDPSPTRCR